MCWMFITDAMKDVCDKVISPIWDFHVCRSSRTLQGATCDNNNLNDSDPKLMSGSLEYNLSQPV